jgi:hypothetical protein
MPEAGLQDSLENRPNMLATPRNRAQGRRRPASACAAKARIAGKQRGVRDRVYTIVALNKVALNFNVPPSTCTWLYAASVW